MASGLSHILITQKLIQDCTPKQLKQFLSFNRAMVCLGAVAPDLPYLSILDEKILDNEEFLADEFHYRHTDQIVLEGLKRIKESTDNLESRTAQFAFILGYASHVIVDGVFHPFVRDMVGDYNAGNQSKHRTLEMKIDVLLMKHLYGLDLNTSGLQDVLTQYKSIRYHKKALELFYELIKFTYGREANYIEKRSQITVTKIEMWISALIRSLDVAEGDFPYFYRKIMGESGFAYREFEDLEAHKDSILILDKPVDSSINNLKDNFLQQNKKIHFLNDVYPKCLEQVDIFWKNAYEHVFNAKEAPNFPAINLDNGRLLSKSQLTEIPHYWRA